jgi:hypothetical protein
MTNSHAGARRWKLATLVIEIVILVVWILIAVVGKCLHLCSTGGVVFCVFWAAHCCLNHFLSNLCGLAQLHDVPAQYSLLFYSFIQLAVRLHKLKPKKEPQGTTDAVGLLSGVA